MSNGGELCLRGNAKVLAVSESPLRQPPRWVLEPKEDGSVVLRHEYDGFLYPVGWRAARKEELGRMDEVDAAGCAFRFTRV